LLKNDLTFFENNVLELYKSLAVITFLPGNWSFSIFMIPSAAFTPRKSGLN